MKIANLIIIGFMLLCGCDYYFDDTILDHLDGISSVNVGEFTVEFYMEDMNDLNTAALAAEEFVEITQLYYSFAEVDALKYVLIYIAHNDSTWREIVDHDETMYDIYGLHTEQTDLGDFIILINPMYWATISREDLTQVFVHELTHQVSARQTGDSDPDHKKIKYWGNDGLMWKVINAYL